MKKRCASWLAVVLVIVLISVSLPGKKASDILYSHKIAKADGETSAAVKIAPGFGKIPLYFIPNQGQVNEKAKFYSKTSQYTLWLTKKGLVFDSIRHSPHFPYSPHSPKIERDFSRLIFLNANQNPGIVPVEMTRHKVNYFMGKDPAKWQKGISTSTAVIYKNLYKNIDLKVYGNERQIEYDWIVNPGGNPGDIRIQYENVKSARIDSEGNLVIETRFGQLIHKKPVSYQFIAGKNIEVKSAFNEIKKNTYGFKVNAYDRKYELIIDPVVTVTYSTFLGGSASERGRGIGIDGMGHIYVTGYTNSTNYPLENQYQEVYMGNMDVFVTKFAADGTGLVFSTFLGGSDYDYGYELAVSPGGDVFVTGYTHSNDFPASNNFGGGNHDAFVSKFDSSGNMENTIYLGGEGLELAHSAAVDGPGNVYITGSTNSADFPLKNSYQSAIAGNYDVFITKCDTDLNIVFSTFFGGSGGDSGTGLAVGASGAIYIAGDTHSSNFPTKNAYQPYNAGGGNEGFASKFSADGSELIYSTYLGGAGTEFVHGIDVDGFGNAYITGEYWSNDFPTKNAFQDTYAGGGDGFIAKLNSGGSDLVYSTYLGGSGYEQIKGIAVNSEGNAFVIGVTKSADFPLMSPFQDTWNGGHDVFVSRMAPDGSELVYSTYLGGAGHDYGEDIALDDADNAYITGGTYSAGFPLYNAYQCYLKGGIDVFVSKVTFTTYHLSVQSAPFTGVPITVTPDDIDGSGSGETGFTRTYNPCQAVTLTAPETFKNKVFKRWIIDGVDNLDRTIQITMEDNHTVKAVYQDPPTRVLTVQSEPGNGVPITVSPNDINGDGDGNTNFKRTYDAGTAVTLTAPEIFNNNIFLKWTIDGGDNLDRTIQLTMDDNHTVKAVYKVPPPTRTLKVESKPYKGVPITVSPADINGDSDGSTFFTRTFNPGEVVTLTAPKAFNNEIFYRWTIDGVGNDNPTIQAIMDNNHTVTAEYRQPAVISLSRTKLYFGADASGTTGGEQTIFISNSGDSTLNWTLTASAPWLHCNPTSGKNNGEVTVSVDVSGLSTGAHNGTITVSAADAANSPQTIDVKLVVYGSGSTGMPFGSFDTPLDGAAVMSSIPVTGWALDDIGVESVKIYREEGKNLVYIGDAVFVEGARPDVELAYPTYPGAYRAGWGYMMLTNFLPDGGNGTFVIHAIVTDKEGNKVTLGKKTIICDNAHAVRPFGAIDTPGQGGTIHGSPVVNFGWVLTPQPNYIPTDGSSIDVWIDGVKVGNPVYNNYRADIALLFPGYANSNGAVGYFYIDTAQYENGVHTIQWTAKDSAGNVDGIGSRYFTIQNTGENSRMAEAGSGVDLARIPVDYSSPLRIKKGYKNIKPQRTSPDDNGTISVQINQLERVEIHLAGQGRRDGKGFQLVGERLRPLPIGSTFNREKGIFYWQPGPGFMGTYRLVFIQEMPDRKRTKKFVDIKIVPGGRGMASPAYIN